jgi:hypothetical protein
MAKFRTRMGLLDYMARGGMPGAMGDMPAIESGLLKAPEGVGGAKIKLPKKKKGKTKEEIKIQGGALSTKLNDQEVAEILDGHGMEWDYHDNGGVTAIEYFMEGGRLKSQRKHFRPGTTIRTLRNWLNY